MPYKPTGKPPGRPRKDGRPAGTTRSTIGMADKNDDPAPTTAPAAIDVNAPEIQALLAEQRRQMMAEVAAMLAQNPTGTPNDMVKVLSDLTSMISDVNNPGNRHTVSPEETRKRKEALDDMGNLLAQARAEGLKPHYVVVGQTWLEGNLVQPYLPDGEGRWKKNEVIWGGAPNVAMRPVNDVAKTIYAAFLRSIGGSTNVEGMQEQAVWLTYGGLAMVGDTPPQSMQQRGNVHTVEPTSLERLFPTSNELTSPDDPNATKIPILGKTFAPAQVTTPGQVPNLNFAR